MLRKQQALQQEELRLQQRKQQLALETEIAKVKAEECVLAEAEARFTAAGEIKGFRSIVPPVVKADFREPEVSKVMPCDTQRLPIRSEQLPISDPGAGRHRLREVDSRNSISSEEGFRQFMDLQWQQQEQNRNIMHIQQQQNRQVQQLLQQQQLHTLALTLPQPEVPTFTGDPIEYCNFIRAFENMIEAKTTSYSARLYYLVQYTAGDVQELMRNCLAMDSEKGYREARKLLTKRYGQPYRIASACVERVTNGPAIKSEDGAALLSFSVLLTSCKNTLTDIGYLSKIENPDSLKKIVSRLPFNLRQKWRDVADTITERQEREVTLSDVASFVEEKARILTHPIFGDISGEPKGKGGVDMRKSTSRRVSSFEADAHNPDNTGEGVSEEIPVPRSSRNRLCCPLCKSPHWLSQCSDFRRRGVNERYELVREKELCYNCLVPGHYAVVCPKTSFCKVDGCHDKHSTFLHPPSARIDDATQPEIGAQSAYVSVGKTRRTVTGAGTSVTGLPVVPVKVRAKGSNTLLRTYAFLDGGSNTTFCSDQLLKDLGARGIGTTLTLTTMERENSTKASSLVQLEVFDLDENNFIELPLVFSTPVLPVSSESVPRQEDVDRWPHLKGVRIAEIDARVGLLIGHDVPKALEPKEVKESQDGGPYATRILLGWAINGPLGRNGNASRTSNFIRRDNELAHMFQRFCNMEFNYSLLDNKREMSLDDKTALEIMESSAVLKEGHYEIALPWRYSPSCLPNNRVLAEHRLKLLRRRLAKDPDLFQKYSAFIENLLDKDYARKVPDHQVNRSGQATWFLPHHPVFHPKKPEKVRVVFDCAAKYRGVSLNDVLLSGPDVTNSLIGVLTRFRQERIAVMADIECMYYQVRVPPKDSDVLRFLLWPGNDLESQPEEYQMGVHLFGAVSSPSCANFALRKAADDNSQLFDCEAINTVKRNFYVDDCLKSGPGEEEAIRLTDDLRRLLEKGGLNLTKWVSNSRKVIGSLPVSERAGTFKDLHDGQLPVERALRVRWDVERDKLCFKIEVKSKPLNRRGLLSVVCSLYDPLGFVAPIVLPAKVILQDLCRRRLEWDDPIPDDERNRWLSWLEDLPKLKQLSVDRCLKPPGFGKTVSVQLHHFSDASQQGYGAVSYLRFLNDKDAIHCSFVMGKARTAPLKTVTIPRLELSAAVVASRLDKTLRKEIDISVDESVFWTDSTCVISYIQNNDKRFHTFVANRIAIIHDATSPSQWRYVDSERNPADDASRGLTVDSLISKNRWINGPDFLWEPESKWPVQPVAQMPDDDPEIKRESQALLSLTNAGTNYINQLLEYFSSWSRLKKFVAWILRYREKLKQSSKRCREGLVLVQDSPEDRIYNPLSVDEIDKAEKEILKFVQRQSFEEELSRLEEQEDGNRSNDLKSAKDRKPQIKKSSAIYKLDPMKVGGLLYVGGRLRQAPISQPAKHQIILPNKHHVVDLIVRYYHLMSGHSGLEHVFHDSRKVLDSQSEDGCKEGCDRLLRLQKKASPARKAKNGRPAHRPGDACKTTLYVCRN